MLRSFRVLTAPATKRLLISAFFLWLQGMNSIYGRFRGPKGQLGGRNGNKHKGGSARPGGGSKVWARYTGDGRQGKEPGARY